MAVLLEPRGRGEGLAALVAGVAPGAHVAGADVPLEVAAVGEDGVAVLTSVLPAVAGHVAVQTLLAAVGPGTLLAAVQAPGVLVEQH